MAVDLKRITKGKVERPYDFIERNFLVGRKFADMADLNRQALEWIEYANRRRCPGRGG